MGRELKSRRDLQKARGGRSDPRASYTNPATSGRGGKITHRHPHLPASPRLRRLVNDQCGSQPNTLAEVMVQEGVTTCQAAARHADSGAHFAEKSGSTTLQMTALREKAAELDHLFEVYQKVLHPRVKTVIGHLHLPLLDWLLREIGFEDEDYLASLMRGRPVLGQAADSSANVACWSPCEVDLEEWAKNPRARNEQMLQKIRPSKDGSDELSQEVEEILKEELRCVRQGKDALKNEFRRELQSVQKHLAVELSNEVRSVMQAEEALKEEFHERLAAIQEHLSVKSSKDIRSAIQPAEGIGSSSPSGRTFLLNSPKRSDLSCSLRSCRRRNSIVSLRLCRSTSPWNSQESLSCRLRKS